MNIQDLHKSKTVRGILMGIGIAILVLVIFQTGVTVGYHKARFVSRFGDNFNKNFVDPKHGGAGDKFLMRGMPGGHGALGEIVNISMPQIVVAGPDNLEKTILVGTTTRIRQFQNEITINDLKIGDFIVVLGVPNSEGQIEAKLIRTMPTPPARSVNNQ